MHQKNQAHICCALARYVCSVLKNRPMKSAEIYHDIKNGHSKRSYPFLKNKYIRLIKARYTINNCLVEAEERFVFAFEKLYEKIASDTLPNQQNLKAYFLTTCKNNFLVEIKRNKVYFTDNLPEHCYHYEETNQEIESISVLTSELLGQLPTKLREVSSKIYMEDKDHKEIADELEMNYHNVRKYQHKAISILKAKTPMHYRDYIRNVA